MLASFTLLFKSHFMRRMPRLTNKFAPMSSVVGVIRWCLIMTLRVFECVHMNEMTSTCIHRRNWTIPHVSSVDAVGSNNRALC